MDSENEKQFGRRRSFRKPMMPPKKDSSQAVEDQQKAIGEKSPEEILSILEAEKSGDVKTEEAEKPVMEKKQSSRFKKPSRPKPERPKKAERAQRTSRRPAGSHLPKARKTDTIKLSVVIPAYNEEGNVEELLRQFDDLFNRLPYKAEMVFVDDGSEDKTLLKAREAQSRYRWLRIYNHRINKGLTEALETGFSKATGKIICFYPSDLQYHANDIPKMVSKIDSGADVVTGWKKGWYGFKIFGSFIYNMLSRRLFGVKVHDLNSIKMFKQEVTEHFTYRRGWHRYIVVMAAQSGFKIDEVKVKLYPRKSGKSKFGLAQLPVGFLDLLSVKFELSFTKKPLLFFGSAGLFCGFLGFLIGLVSLYLRFVENAGYRPLLYAVILLLISGLMLFSIGFLAELIVGIKEEISKKKSFK